MILKWVLANQYWCCAYSLSLVQLFVTVTCDCNLWTVTCQALLSMGILQVRILEWVAMPSSRDFPNPGIEPMCHSLQMDSLQSEKPGKPKNTGVGSLSFLQGIFLIQEWNQVPLHCIRILYQLGYQGIPINWPINDSLIGKIFPLRFSNPSILYTV